jgi:hypothetical protein
VRYLVRSLMVLAICLFALNAKSQEYSAGTAEPQELANARALLEAGREDVIRDEMRFSEAEAALFWPVYENYRLELTGLRERYADLIVGYLRAYRDGAVTESDAVRLIDDYLDIKSQQLQIRKKHLEYFREALPPRKATRFYQLENKLDAELDAQLAMFVPLMDPV